MEVKRLLGKEMPGRGLWANPEVTQAEGQGCRVGKKKKKNRKETV